VDAPAEPEPVTWLIPTWRVDLKREADLIEEVCRLHGVDKIPATPPRGAIGANEYDAVHDQLAEVRRLLTGLGLNEAQGQTLIGANAAERVATAGVVLLANPLSSDMNALRPSLLPGLLDSLQHNVGRRECDLALFEVGRVFAQAEGSPRESRRLALALTGRRQPVFWSGADREANFDLADLKGVLEEFFDHFGLRGVTHVPREAGSPLFAESAAITLGGRVPLGELGQLGPALARQHDLRAPVWLAELDLDQLLARRQAAKTFKPLPQFPAVRRDAALLVTEGVTHDAVLAAVRQARVPGLEQVELFDVFRGQNVPAGHKSVAYAFTYRAADRTLTDEEVNTAHAGLLEHLKRSLGAAVREA
jgi:phenylalanyl-tRNA synthetase beta chain